MPASPALGAAPCATATLEPVITAFSIDSATMPRRTPFSDALSPFIDMERSDLSARAEEASSPTICWDSNRLLAKVAGHAASVTSHGAAAWSDSLSAHSFS